MRSVDFVVGTLYYRYCYFIRVAIALEAHNRLLFLQKEINGGSNELEDQLENIATLLQKFISLSFYGISASAAYETSEISLQKIERETMLNDALNHIRHVIECIKRAKEEPPTEVTLPQTSQSESIESLSDF
uniref:Uncharacterized protein n=1 Tax=Panagrolaimus davidi TaxID=227884 RepID=A0A914P411_9BILA